jgi:hypothetical protein
MLTMWLFEQSFAPAIRTGAARDGARRPVTPDQGSAGRIGGDAGQTIR